LERFSAQLGYLELHRSPLLSLHHYRTRVDVIFVGKVADSKTQEVAGAELGIDRQVKQGEVSEVAAKLQPDTDRPYLAELERCLLADDLALVPGNSALPTLGSHGVLPV
jgi:hypothetical protein